MASVDITFLVLGSWGDVGPAASVAVALLGNQLKTPLRVRFVTHLSLVPRLTQLISSHPSGTAHSSRFRVDPVNLPVLCEHQSSTMEQQAVAEAPSGPGTVSIGAEPEPSQPMGGTELRRSAGPSDPLSEMKLLYDHCAGSHVLVFNLYALAGTAPLVPVAM